ncbi:DUF262 domain-containing protein [Rubellimicrobium rubrum]|uniref:DUF262 domain-containing protein n=1 Tax=Rubellimicrobium rubrum TaxID=2585369 RepID=UPI00159B964D|nr:DUF262 domain-containing protein [Rubellimicrobium rubrum]
MLGDQRRFVVPIYQRQYSWREKRLEPFWEDVVAKADEALDGKPKFSHYMGALILAPGGDGFTIGATPRVQVVDGQQRLTTFQLFLAALREVGEELGVPGLRDAIANYLFVRPMSGDTDPDARFKLVPTPEDRAVFHLIIEGGLAAVRAKHPHMFFQNGKVIQRWAPLSVIALAFFAERIRTYVRSGLQDVDEDASAPTDEGANAPLRRLNALLEALLNHLKLVVITLAENDDAQVIFETLNSQAEPLLAMDLVRNNIFHRASGQGESAEALFETKWRPFDAPFWKADAPRAKPRRPRIDHFLSHALTAQTGEETSLRELYAEYRAFARPKGKPRFATVEAELEALTTFAPIYQTLEEEKGNDEALARLGVKLNVWEVSTAYPLVFKIATSAASPTIKAELYGLIYSYLVRRAICGLTPKNLNKTFARLVSVMLADGVSVETFARAFASQSGDAVRFPNDVELRAAVQRKPVYLLFPRKDRLADILWELECASRTKYSVSTPRPLYMSIEHIMPRSWTAHWPLPDGRLAPPDKLTGVDEAMAGAIAARDALIHTLGNLTLVTMPANAAASNSAVEAKKQWLAQSLLALNLAIVGQPNWDEIAIQARGAALADLAVGVWPAPPAVQPIS